MTEQPVFAAYAYGEMELTKAGDINPTEEEKEK